MTCKLLTIYRCVCHVTYPVVRGIRNLSIKMLVAVKQQLQVLLWLDVDGTGKTCPVLPKKHLKGSYRGCTPHIIDVVRCTGAPPTLKSTVRVNRYSYLMIAIVHKFE